MWSLGIILYKMVEGGYPFEGKNSKDILNNIIKKELTFKKSIRISKQLKNLIEGLLIKNPKYRIDNDSILFNKFKNGVDLLLHEF